MTATITSPDQIVAPGSKSTISTTMPPSMLPVGATPDDDWALRRRKGNRVRYQNTRNGAWDRAYSLEPGDVLYQEPKEPPSIIQSMRQGAKVMHEVHAQMEAKVDGTAARIADVQPEVTKPTQADMPVEARNEWNRGILEQMTRDDLRKLAADANIAGRGSMNKAQLIDALITN
ncbi:hypothetical protein SEA_CHISANAKITSUNE_74 [Gordonia phage ChisanaKitsune]|uniref:Rho termination factor-like N-terminal domain-containing protein n=1 Tax=Gordonia phage ChisanaKitsune TaxID=2871538 RepID=A0AAE8BY33_9CAUD|nr:hypothetical protein PQD15_gp074 [Gordonia phage ChisanaKitsune]QZE10840.1 hypothetical protein SEA_CHISANAKITSUNE_74 [Gordonia phage ChisanaKitsune]